MSVVQTPDIQVCKSSVVWLRAVILRLIPQSDYVSTENLHTGWLTRRWTELLQTVPGDHPYRRDLNHWFDFDIRWARNQDMDLVSSEWSDRLIRYRWIRQWIEEQYKNIDSMQGYHRVYGPARPAQLFMWRWNGQNYTRSIPAQPQIREWISARSLKPLTNSGKWFNSDQLHIESLTNLSLLIRCLSWMEPRRWWLLYPLVAYRWIDPIKALIRHDFNGFIPSFLPILIPIWFSDTDRKFCMDELVRPIVSSPSLLILKRLSEGLSAVGFLSSRIHKHDSQDDKKNGHEKDIVFPAWWKPDSLNPVMVARIYLMTHIPFEILMDQSPNCNWTYFYNLWMHLTDLFPDRMTKTEWIVSILEHVDTSHDLREWQIHDPILLPRVSFTNRLAIDQGLGQESILDRQTNLMTLLEILRIGTSDRRRWFVYGLTLKSYRSETEDWYHALITLLKFRAPFLIQPDDNGKSHTPPLLWCHSFPQMVGQRQVYEQEIRNGFAAPSVDASIETSVESSMKVSENECHPVLVLLDRALLIWTEEKKLNMINPNWTSVACTVWQNLTSQSLGRYVFPHPDPHNKSLESEDDLPPLRVHMQVDTKLLDDASQTVRLLIEQEQAHRLQHRRQVEQALSRWCEIRLVRWRRMEKQRLLLRQKQEQTLRNTTRSFELQNASKYGKSDTKQQEHVNESRPNEQEFNGARPNHQELNRNRPTDQELNGNRQEALDDAKRQEDIYHTKRQEDAHDAKHQRAIHGHDTKPQGPHPPIVGESISQPFFLGTNSRPFLVDRSSSKFPLDTTPKLLPTPDSSRSSSPISRNSFGLTTTVPVPFTLIFDS